MSRLSNFPVFLHKSPIFYTVILVSGRYRGFIHLFFFIPFTSFKTGFHTPWLSFGGFFDIDFRV